MRGPQGPRSRHWRKGRRAEPRGGPAEALDAQIGTRLRAGSAQGLEVALGKVSSNLKSKDRPCFYLTIGVDEGQTLVVQRRDGSLGLGWRQRPKDWREEGGEKPGSKIGIL